MAPALATPTANWELSLICTRSVDPAGSVMLESMECVLGLVRASPSVNRSGCWLFPLWGGQYSQGKSGTAVSFAFGLALWQGAVAGLAQRRKILVASPLGIFLRSGIPGQAEPSIGLGWLCLAGPPGLGSRWWLEPCNQP